MSPGPHFGILFRRPFLQVHSTMSPGPHFGILFRRPPTPFTAIMYRFLAPLLSAQFIRVATAQPTDILSLAFLPARPRFIAYRALRERRGPGRPSWAGRLGPDP